MSEFMRMSSSGSSPARTIHMSEQLCCTGTTHDKTTRARTSQPISTQIKRPQPHEPRQNRNHEHRQLEISRPPVLLELQRPRRTRRRPLVPRRSIRWLPASGGWNMRLPRFGVVPVSRSDDAWVSSTLMAIRFSTSRAKMTAWKTQRSLDAYFKHPNVDLIF